MSFYVESLSFFACSLFYLAYTQTPPVEPSDFSGWGVLLERHGNNWRRLPGDIFEDSTKKRQRFDVKTHESNNDIISVYRFWDKMLEYEYFSRRDTCVKRHIVNATFHPAFDWLATATKFGDCHSRHHREVTGTQWRKDEGNGFRHDLCAANNASNTPLWVERHHGQAHSRVLEFSFFKGGAPENAVFNLPATCVGL